MSAQKNFNALLKHTLQPRTRERGMPYFPVIEKAVKPPKPLKCESESPEPSTYCSFVLGHEGPCSWEKLQPAKEPRDWYPVWLLVVTVAIVVGLILGNYYGWR